MGPGHNFVHNKFRKFDPAINRKYLVLLSGIVWSIVGVMLCRLAVQWLSGSDTLVATGLSTAGIVMSLLIHRMGFMKIVNKNIERILSMKEKVCIFGFQPWRSYFIVAVMIGMGIALRHSPVPKPYLAIIYIGFGGAMILSSLKYYRAFIQIKKQ